MTDKKNFHIEITQINSDIEYIKRRYRHVEVLIKILNSSKFDEKDTFLKSLYKDKTPEYLKSELRYFAQEIRKLTSDLSGKNEDMVEKLMSQYNFDHI